MIAQKENLLNLRMAKSSLQVAEASQRDSATMKEMAKDSQMVAIATSRDSSMMRIIAVVTMVFLPPTFTAVRTKFVANPSTVIHLPNALFVDIF